MIKGTSSKANLVIGRIFGPDGPDLGNGNDWFYRESDSGDNLWRFMIDPDQDGDFIESNSSDIISNSWSRSNYGDYDSWAETADKAVKGDFGKPVVMVFAVGNDGSNNRVGPPSTGKNVISVGASADYRSIFNNYNSNNLYVMGYSQRGTDESGRVKPDILAPGSYITSSLPTGVNIDGYDSWEGTSMATPHVAAVAAQILKNHPSASPALVKAFMISSAVGGGTTNSPNVDQAWGRLAALASIYKLPDEYIDSYRESTVGNLLSGKHKDLYDTVDVPDGANKFVATMVYSDDPGDPLFSAFLNNDLDLYLKDPNGNILYENDDSVNNVEKYVINNPIKGIWEIHIKAKDLADLGGILPKTQDYAISWTVLKQTKAPDIPIIISSTNTNVKIGESFDISASITSSGLSSYDVYSKIEFSPLTGLTLLSSSDDKTDKEYNVLGDIPVDTSRNTKNWKFRADQQGVYSIKVTSYGKFIDGVDFIKSESISIVVSGDSPVITNIYHLPSSPKSSNSVHISSGISDLDGVSNAQAKWSLDQSFGNTITMSHIGGDSYKTSSPIPAQSTGKTVNYKVCATDSNSNNGCSSVYSYTVGSSNQAPSVATPSLNPNPSYQGQTVSVSASVTDFNGNSDISTVVAEIQNGVGHVFSDSTLSYNSGTGTASGSITAPSQISSDYYVVVTATDKSGLQGSGQAQLTVKESSSVCKPPTSSLLDTSDPQMPYGFAVYGSNLSTSSSISNNILSSESVVSNESSISIIQAVIPKVTLIENISSKIATENIVAASESLTLQDSATCKGIDGNYNCVTRTSVFSPSDTLVYNWLEFGDVFEGHYFKWKWYKPDGNLVVFANGKPYSEYTLPSPGSGRYYPNLKLYSGMYISGYNVADFEGLWEVKTYLDGVHLTTLQFNIKYIIADNTMTTGLDANNDPISRTSTFSRTDEKAESWLMLEKVSNSLNFKWDWYDPSGSLYTTFSTTSSDPVEQGYPYWDEVKGWSYTCVNGYSAADKPGQWEVKVNIDDEYKYSEFFTITDDLLPSVGASHSPQNPTDQDSVSITVSANDNAGLNKVELHWNDGTWKTETWNSPDNPFSGTKNLGKLSVGKTIQYYAIAYDKSGNTKQTSTYSFSVLDGMPPSISISHSPTNPTDKDNIILNINANDNNILNKVELYWNNGTMQTKTWLPNSNSFSLNYNIGTFEGSKIVQYYTKAYDGSEKTSTTNTYSFTPTDTTLPPKPNPKANPSGWTSDSTPTIYGYAVVDYGSGVNRYEYQIDSTGGSWTSVGTSTSFETPVLSDGDHTIYIRTIDYAGLISEIGSVVVYIDASDPNAPPSIAWDDGTYSTDTTIVANWGDVTDTSDILDYYLQVDVDSTDFTSGMIYNGWIDSSTSSKTLTGANGVSDGHTYYYRVYAKNGAGLSGGWSSTSNGVSVDTTINTPVGLTANPSSWTATNSFTLSWSHPSDLSGKIGAYYKKDSAPTSNTDGTYIASNGISQISGITVSADGSHPVYVWLKDNAGNINFNNRDSTSLYLDSSPPSSLSISINNGAAYTISNTVTLTISATESYSTPIQMSFSNDGISWSPWESFSNTKNGWSLSGYGGNSNDGTKTVYFKAKDAVGNEVSNANAASDTITLDTLPPETTISPLTSDTIWRNSNSVTLTASDASEIAATYYKINGGVQQTYSGTFTLPEGTNTVEYWSVDKAGYTETSHTATIKVDTEMPTTTITPASSNTWHTTSQTITLTTGSDTSAIAGTYYKLDDGTTQIYTSPFTASEGNHTYTYWSVDNAGNLETYNNARIKIDTMAPVVTLQSPTSSDFVFARKENELSVNYTYAESNPSQVKIEVFKDSTIIGTKTISNLVGGNNVLRNDSVLLSITAPDETFDVKVILDDEAGNTPAVSLENGAVKIDSIAPAISSIKSNKTIVSGGEPIEINVSASDNNGVVSVVVDGTPLVLSGGFWTGVSSATNVEGTHSMSVIATDYAGNSITNTSVSYIVDNTPPEVIILSPLEGDVVKGIVSITGSITDTYLQTNLIKIDGTQVSTALPYSWDTSSYTETAHTIYVTGTDQAGNSNSSQVNITVDRTDPVISLNSPTSSDYVYSHANGNVEVTYSYDETNPSSIVFEIFNGTTTIGSKTITSGLAGGNDITRTDSVTLSETASDGIYDVKVTITDKANNQPVNSSQPDALKIDNTLPIITNIDFDNNYVRSGVAIRINVSASDNLGISTVTANETILVNADGVWSGLLYAVATEGTHVVNITVKDEAGNFISNLTKSYAVDNTPASVTNMSLSSKTPKINGSVNITAEVVDNNLSQVRIGIKYPNSTYFSNSMNNLNNNIYYYEFNDTSQFGRYNLTFIGIDGAGNMNDTQMDWFVTVKTFNSSLSMISNSTEIVNATNESTVLEIFASNDTVGTIEIKESCEPFPDTNSSFSFNALGKFISINATEELKRNISWTIIKLYYTQAELDSSGLDESSLSIIWYNETSNIWETLDDQTMDWVYDTGIDTTDTSDYSGYVWANVSHFSYYSVEGSPTETPYSNNAPSSGGGGGGGGGGGTSGEAYENIQIKEKYDKEIYKDISTNYHFPKNYLIEDINITGNVNAGLITTMVEVLRNTSTLVNESAPGNVYKNVNIWVGTSGFAVPKNIKEATIKFGVNKDWLDENDIREVVMHRYTDDEWVKITTKKIGEENGSVMYYAITNRFSPYAISGFSDKYDEEVSQSTNEEPTATVTSDEEKSELDTVGFIAGLIGLALPKSDDKTFGSILMIVGLVGIVVFLGLLRRRMG